eukprot:TRINITY_DN15306_c0_g1_i2.p3 TRINITY_DN15306_c0_g1~~TRINITY_DN15306_c0_g1_i2.p3  ORF type:complete len:103 (-),score=39.06 TRINITY_DN15306_c0_g1_i2:73-381(-)
MLWWFGMCSYYKQVYPRHSSFWQEKRSADSDCEELSEIEKAAFTVCESDGADGLTWAEVEECEAQFADSAPVPLPTLADFNMFDLNNDGVIFLEEWQEKTGC